MGWLTPEEQQLVKRRYGIETAYICNGCGYPIIGAPVIDPKGGYHPWPDKLPITCRPFLSRNPKVTYHLKSCSSVVKGTRREEKARKKYEDILQAMKQILELLQKKSYTKERLVEKLAPTSSKIVGRALRELKKEKKIKKKKGGYIVA